LSPARSGMRRTRRVCGPFVRAACRQARDLLTSERTTTGTRGWAAQGPSNPASQGFGQAPRTGLRWELQAEKSSRAERRRLPASEAGCLNRRPFPLLFQKQRATFATAEVAMGVKDRRTWRRGRGETPGVPHAPLGKRNRGDRLVSGRTKNRGDDARLDLSVIARRHSRSKNGVASLRSQRRAYARRLFDN
jgi:hypothetical protein